MTLNAIEAPKVAQASDARRGDDQVAIVAIVILATVFISGIVTAWLLQYNAGALAGLVLAGIIGIGLISVALRNMALFVALLLLARPAADGLRGGIASDNAGVGGTALALLALTFCGLWLMLNLRKHGLFSDKHELTLALIIFFSTVSAIAAVVPQRGMMDVARLASAAVVSFTVARVATSLASRKAILGALILSSLMPLYFGATQLAHGIDRVEGTLAQPNAMGFFLAMILTLGTAIWFELKNRWRIALSLLLIVAGIELLFTFSRGGWLAALIGLSIVGLLRSKKLLLGIAAVVFLVAVFVPSAAARVQEVQRGRELTGYGQNTLLWRLDYWGEALKVSEDSRLIGIGFGMTRFHGSGLQPHNDYIRMFVETGIFGLAAFIAFLLSVIWLARRALRAGLAGLDRAIAIGLAGVVGAYSMYSVSGNLISYPVQLWFFFALIGLADAAISNHEQTRFKKVNT